MEQENLSFSLLDMIERPAFCVHKGAVVYANQSAQHLQITTQTPLRDILGNDTAYRDFTGGQLSLTVLAAGVPCRAQLTRSGEYDVFVLSTQNPELRAIALAAQHLRSPLSTVMTVAERLAVDNPTQSVEFCHLQRGLHQLHRLVCNMSDSYRYQQNNLLKLELTDITSVFNESMEAIATYLNDSGVSLTYSTLKHPVTGLADREMLERAIYNLISNAVKFMNNNCPLDVKLTQSGNLLSFTVQNQGQEKGNPFSRFLREPGAEDGRHGIGLGMELIRAVAASHGGTVLVDQPDDGSFRITMTLSIQSSTENTVRSTIQLPISNYAGGFNRCLLELSEVLPADAYQDKT